MNILFLAREMPFPADSGVKMRAWLVLKQLAAHHKVTLICYDATGARPLRDICESVVTVPSTPSMSAKLCPKLLFGLFSAMPYAIQGRFSKKYDAAVKAVLAEKKIDLIVCDSVYLALYLPPRGYRILLNEHNIESTIIERYISTEKNGLRRRYAAYEAQRMKAFENKIWTRCDLIFACSQVDKEQIEDRTGLHHVEVVPNGVERPALRTAEERPYELVYTGLIGWRPNEDAVLFFAKHIYPRIKQVLPQVRFFVVGKNPSNAVRALQKDASIKVTGTVPDVQTYIEQGSVIVVPLRIGSGTRLKILEALVLHKAVVSTSIGCEGLEVTNGENILIADQAKDFADAVIKLLEDPPLRQKLGANGRKLVEQKYSFEVIGKQIEAILHKL